MSDTPCSFCNYAGPSEVLADHGDVIVFEPLNPVTRGHVLVVPKEHVSPDQPNHHVTGRAFEVAALEAEWRVGGAYNLIASSGVEATQTVPHLHVHVVPRREGDGLALPWSPKCVECGGTYSHTLKCSKARWAARLSGGDGRDA